MTEVNQDFSMYSGEDKTLEITVTQDGSALDMTGYTLCWCGLHVVKDLTDGIALKAGEPDVAVVSLDSVDTLGITGVGTHQLVATDPTGEISVVTTGGMTVTKSRVGCCS